MRFIRPFIKQLTMAKKISVKIVGKPPLSGAAAFAQLLIDMQTKPRLKLVSDAESSRKSDAQKRG